MYYREGCVWRGEVVSIEKNRTDCCYQVSEEEGDDKEKSAGPSEGVEKHFS